MAGIKIADRTMAVLQKSLDLRAQKQQVVAANIANAETPGYAARKFTFEADLRNALAGPETPLRISNAKHFPLGSSGINGVQGQIIKQRDNSSLGDGNSVSIDDEMFRFFTHYHSSLSLLSCILLCLVFSFAFRNACTRSVNPGVCAFASIYLIA